MKKLIIIAAVAVLGFSAPALAWVHGMVSGGGGGCSNALKFNESCNSQYIAGIF
jgi:hypothetical protein